MAAALMLALILTGCGGEVATEADLILLNGKVITADCDFSVAEAVAVDDGRIIAVGASEEIRALAGESTRVIELNGAAVLPGLIDSHAHLVSLGNELVRLNISPAKSYQDIIELVAQRVADSEPGEWILGGRWDHTEWPETRFPEHEPLSAVSPGNPVFLTRVDGNSAFANARAMELAGITATTPDPEGGRIIRDAAGNPTGVLINQAMNLVKRIIPEETPGQSREKLRLAVEQCLRDGLTGVHEAGVSAREIQYFKDLVDAGELGLRVYAMLGEQSAPRFQVDDLAAYFKSQRLDNYGGHMLSVRSIKLYFDGALGSRGAAFFEDYADDSGNRGLFRVDPGYITEVGLAALEAGMGVNTHCIGIRGNAACLDAYAKALEQHPGADHRFRIEHAQIVRKEDVDRFAELGVIPAMQPTHCTSDMNFVEERVGPERARGAYAWQWFREAGLIIPAGSDFPVESTNPFYGIYAAITRQDHDGKPPEGWHPEHRMSREDALRGFTTWAAFASFQEDILGSIEVGKLADLTIIDRDILSVPAADIPSTKVLYTIVGGEIKYQGETE